MDLVYKPVADIDEIIIHINYCLLPKLSRDVDEIDNHPEYYDRHSKLDNHFPQVLHLLTAMDFNNVDRLTPNVLPSLLILYLQRTSPAFWNTPKCISYVQTLEQVFMDKSGVALDSVLKSSDFCNVQEVFDNIMLDLNYKIANDLKRYPGLIDVYCLIMKNLKVILFKSSNLMHEGRVFKWKNCRNL